MFTKTALIAVVPLIMALMAGALIPVQAASGGTLGRVLGNPMWGAAAALFIGFFALLIVAFAFRLPLPSISNALQGPWWMWIGGITGAIYVATSLALLPKIGAASFIVCVIAGQMIAAMLLDHFGLLGLTAKPINVGRAIGVGIMFVGLLVAQFSSSNLSTPIERHPQTEVGGR